MDQIVPEQTMGQDAIAGWEEIDWPACERLVGQLQGRIFRATQRGQKGAVRNLQKLLARSGSAKLLAIRRVTQDNQGRSTPGIDGNVYLTAEARSKWSQEEDFGTRRYKPKPAKRVYIPKSSGGRRPLGIPTMKDRAMQAIIKTALEPEWEAKFEPNSYGFRPGRCCQDAIEQIRRCIGRREGQESSPVILDADIAGCFDNIAHKPLLERVPTFRNVIRRWLKAGTIELGNFAPTLAGTPQGGVISPLLANIALDGMERIFGIENARGEYLRPHERPGNKGISLVRYADDFLVFSRNKYEVEWYVLPKLRKFLGSRGLELHALKTRVTTRGAGFNFLGFTIRQVWTKYHKILLVVPQKEKVKHLLAKVKSIISANRHAKQESLIKLLNPVIRGWAQYYRHCNAKRTFKNVDSRIFRMIWAWCVRRHPKKGKRWIKARYFLTVGRRYWVFGVRPATRLVSAAEVAITRYAKVRGYYSPHDPAHRRYWAWRTRQAIEDWYFSPPKKTILATQHYRCWRCHHSFQAEDAIHFHHEVRRNQGGPTTKENLRAVHSRCHRLLHKHPD